MTAPHGHVDIAGYLFGLLDPVEYRRVEEHLASCGPCRHEVTMLREIENSLDEVPPELFLDGPDPQTDLLLQRTLRAARAESEVAARRSWGRGLVAGAAAVVALALAVGGGVVLGRSAQQDPGVALPPSPSASSVPGTRTLSNTDPTTGAQMTATVVPATEWVKVNAKLTGIKIGEACEMVVHSTTGGDAVAGSWVISAKAASMAGGWPTTGTAAIAPDDVESIEIRTTAGRHLVTVDF